MNCCKNTLLSWANNEVSFRTLIKNEQKKRNNTSKTRVTVRSAAKIKRNDEKSSNKPDEVLVFEMSDSENVEIEDDIGPSCLMEQIKAFGPEIGDDKVILKKDKSQLPELERKQERKKEEAKEKHQGGREQKNSDENSFALNEAHLKEESHIILKEGEIFSFIHHAKEEIIPKKLEGKTFSEVTMRKKSGSSSRKSSQSPESGPQGSNRFKKPKSPSKKRKSSLKSPPKSKDKRFITQEIINSDTRDKIPSHIDIPQAKNHLIELHVAVSEKHHREEEYFTPKFPSFNQSVREASIHDHNFPDPKSK